MTEAPIALLILHLNRIELLLLRFCYSQFYCSNLDMKQIMKFHFHLIITFLIL